MWTPLRLWRDAAARPPAPPPLPAPAAPALAPVLARASVRPPVPAPTPADELDRRHAGLLLQVDAWTDTDPTPPERVLLKRLQALDGPMEPGALVPRRPAQLPRILGLLQREGGSSARELAHLVAEDPALLGEVMRMVNSVRFHGNRRLDTLEQALLMLGEDGLWQLVTRALMTPVFGSQKGRYARLAVPGLWEVATRAGHACAWQRRHHSDGFEAYLAGMVAETGLIVTARLMDQLALPPTAQRSARFVDQLLPLSARLSRRIAQQWSLPDSVLAALDHLAAPWAAEGPEAGGTTLAPDLQAAVRCARLQRVCGQTAQSAIRFAEAAHPCYRELQRAFTEPDGRPAH